jgi:tRNA A-37 threonylcarbamoyl transferase component Bud32
MHFIKRFPNTPVEEIKREAMLQRRAAKKGMSPNVIRCTKKTIVSEHLDEMCLADKYGKDMDDLPDWVRREIVEILWKLYKECDIEYIDITPFNFIEKEGTVWVIDFGHARSVTPDTKLEPYLLELFDTWELKCWNKDFA